MEVNCPTCGASMQISHTTDQFMCTYCGTTTSLNKADTLYTYIMPFAVTDPRAKDIFKRWATGPGKAPDLLRGSKNVKWEKYYLPVAKVVRLVRDE